MLKEAAKAYNKYVQDQGNQLVTVLDQLNTAIKSGDLKKATEAYGLLVCLMRELSPSLKRLVSWMA